MSRTITINVTQADGTGGWGLSRWSRRFHYWVRAEGWTLCGRLGPWQEVRVQDEALADNDHHNADNCKRCQKELAKRWALLPASAPATES